MKKMEDIEPDNKSSWAYFQWLKRDNIRQLRRAGHKADNLNLEPRKRKRFASSDGTKTREIESSKTYWDWMELHEGGEPLEANPDLHDDDLDNTVDG